MHKNVWMLQLIYNKLIVTCQMQISGRKQYVNEVCVCYLLLIAVGSSEPHIQLLVQNTIQMQNKYDQNSPVEHTYCKLFIN